LLLAAGTGAFTWLQASMAHASFGIHSPSDFTAWLTGLTLSGALATVFYSRQGGAGESQRAQARLEFDPAAERRLRLRQFLIEIGGEGMSREDFAVLEAMRAGSYVDVQELGRSTRLAPGESTRRVRQLENLGLVQSYFATGVGYFDWSFRLS